MNKYIEEMGLIPPDAFTLMFNKLSKSDFESEFTDGLDFDKSEVKNLYNNRLRAKNLYVFWLIRRIDGLYEESQEEIALLNNKLTSERDKLTFLLTKCECTLKSKAEK